VPGMKCYLSLRKHTGLRRTAVSLDLGVIPKVIPIGRESRVCDLVPERFGGCTYCDVVRRSVCPMLKAMPATLSLTSAMWVPAA
jgi:hypothetical protein